MYGSGPGFEEEKEAEIYFMQPELANAGFVEQVPVRGERD